MAVVLTQVQTKQIIYINETILKHSTNNTKHSKYKYTYYQNQHIRTHTHTLQNKTSYNRQQFLLHQGSNYYIARASKTQRLTHTAGPRASPSSQIIVFTLTEHHSLLTANSSAFPVTQTRKTI